MRIAFADPPYFGQGKKLYGQHHDEAHVWDSPDAHRDLIWKLESEYDGFALCASTPSLTTGAYGIPAGVRYTYVGDVVSLVAEVPDKRRKGRMRRETSWFGYTKADQQIGPFPTRPKAVAGLLAQLGLIQVKGTDTMEPLF